MQNKTQEIRKAYDNYIDPVLLEPNCLVYAYYSNIRCTVEW